MLGQDVISFFIAFRYHRSLQIFVRKIEKEMILQEDRDDTGNYAWM